MAISQQDIIRRWADTWRSLAAWRAPLPAIVAIEKWKGGRLGVAHCHERRAVVYQTGDLVEDLATVLHELAHLAAPNSAQHGLAWRGILVEAVVEACYTARSQRTVSDFDLSVNIVELDAQVYCAVEDWLVRSGQRDVLRAIGVVP